METLSVQLVVIRGTSTQATSMDLICKILGTCQGIGIIVQSLSSRLVSDTAWWQNQGTALQELLGLMYQKA